MSARRKMCPRWDSNPHWTLFESAASAVGLRGRGRPHVGADTPIGPAYPGSLEAPQPVRSRRLPVTQQVSAQSEQVAPAGPGAGVRVMVVEDEALIRLDLVEMLTRRATRSPVRPATARPRSRWPASCAPTW